MTAASKPIEKPLKKGQLTPKQWAEACTLWKSGTMSLPQLAEKFDRHPQTFQKYFKKKGVIKGANKELHSKKVEAEIEKQVMSDAAVTAARIKETKEDHYKMASGLAKLTWAEVLKTKQDGVPVATALNNLKALDAAMSVLKKAREERYAVLGLDRTDSVDENEVPELVISELTADQIEALRARSFSELDELDAEPVQEDPDGDNGVVELN